MTTEAWEFLRKVDPLHTKAFNRSGGNSGTALKPTWIIQRMNEHFGDCGVGWGIYEPKFELVNEGGELLVFCTVSAWHGTPANVLWGVGGDKVASKRKSGVFLDDEAYKKAFTDAVMNALKYIGAGADVHMGLHDDSKYVEQMEAEFGGPPISEDDMALIAQLISDGGWNLEKWLGRGFGGRPLEKLTADEATTAITKLRAAIENKKQKEAA